MKSRKGKTRIKSFGNQLHVHPQFSVFHSLEWGRIMRDVYKCDPNYKIIEKDDGFAGLTMFRIKSILSGKKLTNMPFNFYPEPLFDNENLLIELFEQVILESKHQGVDNIEIKTITPLPQKLIHHLKVHTSIPFLDSILELPENYNILNKSFSKSMRQNLRTSKNRCDKHGGVAINTVRNSFQLEQFYHLLIKMYRDKHRMVCQPFSLFREIFNAENETFNGRVYFASVNDQMTNAVFLILDKLRMKAYYSWAANDDAHRNLGLNYLLLEQAVKELIEQDYESLDFGSTPVGDESLLFFKNRWNCVHKPVYYYGLLKPIKQVDYNNSYLWARNLYRYIPLSILKRLMPVIVPQLA